MNKKKIGIKNLKYCEWMSEETNCFKATVTVDDEDFCHAQDEGKGGMTYFYPIGESNVYELIDELDQWCKDNLPKWKFKGLPNELDTTLEIVVGRLVDDSILRGDYAK